MVLKPVVNNGMDKLPSLKWFYSPDFPNEASTVDLNDGNLKSWFLMWVGILEKSTKHDFNNLDFTQEESAFSYQTLSRCLQNLPKTNIKSTWKVSARDSGSSRFLKSERVFGCGMYGLGCWKQKTLLMSCSWGMVSWFRLWLQPEV